MDAMLLHLLRQLVSVVAFSSRAWAWYTDVGRAKKSFSWVEMLVSKVALMGLCAILVKMRATPKPTRAPTLAPTRISTIAPTTAPAYAEGVNVTRVPSMSPTSEEANVNSSGFMIKFT